MPNLRLELLDPASSGRCRGRVFLPLVFAIASWIGADSAKALTFTNVSANTSAATIPSVGPASLYPSSIIVSGVTGTVSKVTVTLNQLSHSYPDDIDMLLVGPAGQSVLLMSDTGGGSDLTNVVLTFDDAAGPSLPDATQITTGTYKPTNIGTGDTFPAPAPNGSYGATLSVFNATDPNGVWSLYIVDDTTNDAGSLA